MLEFQHTLVVAGVSADGDRVHREEQHQKRGRRRRKGVQGQPRPRHSWSRSHSERLRAPRREVGPARR